MVTAKNTPPKGEQVDKGTESAPPGAQSDEVKKLESVEAVEPVAPPVLLKIAARTEGFRRCGRAWPASGTTVSADDFTAEEIARLKAEPELIVVEVGAAE